MSRTYKKDKDPGTEYWSARPGNKHGSKPGPFIKHVTHKRERQQARRTSYSPQQEEQ